MERLDAALAARGLARSRSHARQLIEEGHVTLNGTVVQKPSHPCGPLDELAVTGGHPYVGRGGVKLEKALDAFGVETHGITALDVGASTGGFTHCLLARGAVKVYAVDVGRDQLAQSLRDDPRVVDLQQTDIRTLSPAAVEVGAQLIVCDVSFISLRLVLPCLKSLLLKGGQVICLVKPQFEAGRESVGKKGIVKDPKVHLRVLEGLRDALESWGFALAGCIPSPLRGGDGNIEYLMLLHTTPAVPPDLATVVDRAFREGE